MAGEIEGVGLNAMRSGGRWEVGGQWCLMMGSRRLRNCAGCRCDGFPLGSAGWRGRSAGPAGPPVPPHHVLTAVFLWPRCGGDPPARGR